MRLTLGEYKPDSTVNNVQIFNEPKTQKDISKHMFLYIPFLESLILAQDKRWRRALNMQVERRLGFPLSILKGSHEMNIEMGKTKHRLKKKFCFSKMIKKVECEGV